MNKGNAYGKGSIYKDEKRGRWIGRIATGKDKDGKTKRKAVYGRTKAEVKKKLKQIEVDIYTGDFLEDSEITIKQLAEQLNNDKLNLGKIKEGTYFRLNETLKRLAPIYNIPLQDCTVTQIKDFLLNEIQYSQSTIDKEYAMLKTVFSEAVERGIILDKNNPMKKVEKPHTKQKKEKVRGLTVDERRKLVTILKNTDTQYAEQMLLSMYTGMRMGEINALKVSDINFDFNRIVINRTVSADENGQTIISDTTKTSAGQRTIPMSADVKQILKNVVGDNKSGFLFLRGNGEPISTNLVKCQFNRIRKKYSFIDSEIDGKVDLHSLRHTYATMCIEAGVDANTLKSLLGHTDIRITMNTYADVFAAHRDTQMDKLTEYLERTNTALSEVNGVELDELVNKAKKA